MSPARILMAMGALLLVAGAVLWLLERGGGGHGWAWIGRLPGDIRIERPNFRFYFPLTSCLLASAALTLIIWLLRRGKP